MSYRSSVNLNRIEYDTILEEKDVDTLKVLEHQLIKNYIYISNTAAFSINNNNQYLFPDGEFSFKLGKSITPKYFKLEYIALPNTAYNQSNNRKMDTRPQPNPLIRQFAPLKMIWREWSGIPLDPVQLFIKDVEPGNYDVDEMMAAVELLMNQSPNNQYKLSYNHNTFRLNINQTSGTYLYSLWFETFAENKLYYENDVEQLVSEYIGYSVIPLPDSFVTGLKISPIAMGCYGDNIILLEIVGTPSILNQSSLNESVQSTFNATFVINISGNKGDYSTFTVNKDFENLVTIGNKITFENLAIKLRNYQTGEIYHFNGSTPYLVFSYEEYGLHENFNK